MNWFKALLAIMVALVPLAAAQQCGGRVRKNWNVLTVQEKTTYITAIQVALDSGAYFKFVELHTEMMSEMEAHGQCMFVYWHRLMLVAFENMLRGQGPQFACVTVPYWDWITDNSRFVSGQCGSMEACSPILTELGGGGNSGQQVSLNINGVSTVGVCVNKSPLNRFCEGANRCARCVTRGAWAYEGFPASTSYASVMNQLFSAASIGQMSPNLERGAHNNMHASLGGAMATLASPADPIFWSHHAMVDLLHVVFHKCRVGTQRLSFAEKAGHRVAWSACGRRNTGWAFSPTDTVMMRTGAGGRNPMPASLDPVIGRYFQGVPNRFADLMDVRDLGASSYSYELFGVATTLYSQCDGQTVAVAQPVPAPVPVPVAPAQQQPSPFVNVQPGSSFSWSFSSRRRSLRAATSFAKVSPGVGATVKAPDLGGDANSPVQSAPTKSASPPVVEAVTIKKAAADPSVTKVMDWYSDMKQQDNATPQQTRDDIERMMCVFQDECLGGVKNYSLEFQQAWGVREPRCRTVLNELKAKGASIGVDKWRDTMKAQFGCPKPVNSALGNSVKQSAPLGSTSVRQST